MYPSRGPITPSFAGRFQETSKFLQTLSHDILVVCFNPFEKYQIGSFPQVGAF